MTAPRTIGEAMIDSRVSSRALRRLAVLAAGLYLIAAPAPARAQDCAPQLLAKVATSTLPDGRLTVPVTVEGHALNFLLDTGGANTTIKWELAGMICPCGKPTAG